MTDVAKRLAAECGFDLCGVAAAIPGEEDTRLAQWLTEGYHGDMAYMERRRDVRELLDGCRSVIALGVNYFTEGTPKNISRYAWGKDYHLVLGAMLDDFTSRLGEQFPGDQFRPYCDTGPILEKAWAERAGIGWIGKNGCLISQEFGSWVFLAVVLTTAGFEPDTPNSDRCGTCEACLSSCPTDAFVAPRVIDAKKCIPYLTIEQWKPIGSDQKIAPWAFGCDACQEVCPWNTKAKRTARKDFAQRTPPDLNDWVTMTGPEFRERYGDTPLLRPGRRGLARNALAVLREEGLDEQTLTTAKTDRSALVRDQAEQC